MNRGHCSGFPHRYVARKQPSQHENSSGRRGKFLIHMSVEAWTCCLLVRIDCSIMMYCDEGSERVSNFKHRTLAIATRNFQPTRRHTLPPADW